MSWSDGSIESIKDIKKTILKKKIILNIIIESNLWYDRVFKVCHMALAIGAPLISFIDQQITGSVESTSTAVIVLNSVVAGMLKVRDYLTFDKLKDQAKQQTIKYQQLYQRIEREIRKPESSRQNSDEFISLVFRELSIIEIDDPNLPQSLKKNYIKLCKDKGIPYDEDLEALGELFANKVQIVVDKSINMPSEQKVIEVTTKKQIFSAENDNRQDYQEKVKTLDTRKDLNWAIERLNNLD